MCDSSPTVSKQSKTFAQACQGDIPPGNHSVNGNTAQHSIFLHPHIMSVVLHYETRIIFRLSCTKVTWPPSRHPRLPGLFSPENKCQIPDPYVKPFIKVHPWLDGLNFCSRCFYPSQPHLEAKGSNTPLWLLSSSQAILGWGYPGHHLALPKFSCPQYAWVKSSVFGMQIINIH